MEPKISPPRKAEIVYYLSREGLLEQPHLLQVPISSAEGLYLRDVKKRLRLIHGTTMPSTFSWSYKRNYKTGYVWQDLCDDDLVVPANGCEYVLKGSRILDAFQNRSSTPGGQDTTYGSCLIQSFASNSNQLAVLERRAESGDVEDSCSVTTFPESQKSDITFEFDQIDGNSLAARTEYAGAQFKSRKEEGVSSKLDPGIANSKDDGPESKTEKLHEYKVYTKLACVGLIETGADAATQTEDQERQPASSKCQDWDGENSRNIGDVQEKPTELEKGEISPPPYSSCSASSSASGKLDGARSPLSCSEKEDQADHQPSSVQAELEHAIEHHTERVEIVPTIHEFARKAVTSNIEIEQTELPASRSKCKSSSNSSGFLQLVSCGGGLEVREEAMPMPIYIKAKHPSQGTVDKIFDLVRLGQSRKKWHQAGGRKKVIRLPKLSHNCSYEPEILPSVNAVVDVELSVGAGRREGYSDQLGVALPDTMSRNMDHQDNYSIATSESSCAKTSRDQVMNHQFKRRSTEGHRRPFPVFGSNKQLVTKQDHSQESGSEPIAASSITSKSLNQPIDFREQLQQLAINSSDQRLGPPTDERYIVSKLGGRKASSYREQDNRMHQQQDMPLLWEELLVTTKKIFTNRDERPLPPYGSKAEWEKRLQFAAEMALPPADFNLSLQQCLQCGRKFAPESLKVHRRSCKGDKRSKSSRTFTLSSSQKPMQYLI